MYSLIYLVFIDASQRKWGKIIVDIRSGKEMLFAFRCLYIIFVIVSMSIIVLLPIATLEEKWLATVNISLLVFFLSNALLSKVGRSCTE